MGLCYVYSRYIIHTNDMLGVTKKYCAARDAANDVIVKLFIISNPFRLRTSVFNHF